MERSAEQRVHAATETFSRREVVPAFALSAAVRCWMGRCLISGRLLSSGPRGSVAPTAVAGCGGRADREATQAAEGAGRRRCLLCQIKMTGQTTCRAESRRLEFFFTCLGPLHRPAPRRPPGPRKAPIACPGPTARSPRQSGGRHARPPSTASGVARWAGAGRRPRWPCSSQPRRGVTCGCWGAMGAIGKPYSGSWAALIAGSGCMSVEMAVG